MVLDDTHAAILREQSAQAANLKQYYVPRDPTASQAHKFVPTLSTKTQKCAYANDDKGACAALTSKTACAKARGCEWNTTSIPAKCVPATCSCTVLSDTSLGKCAAHRTQLECISDSGCHWDAEFATCAADRSLWNVALCLLLLVPVVHVVTYYAVTRADTSRLWARCGPGLPQLYGTSLTVAVLAFAFLAMTIQNARQHMDHRRRYAKPLLLFVVGAVLTPLYQALHVLQDWSRNWVMVGLMVTSGAVMWFVGEYIGGPGSASQEGTHNSRPTMYRNTAYSSVGNWLNFAGTVCAFLMLFHVLVVDNLGWWLLYSSG